MIDNLNGRLQLFVVFVVLGYSSRGVGNDFPVCANSLEIVRNIHKLNIAGINDPFLLSVNTH